MSPARISPATESLAHQSVDAGHAWYTKLLAGTASQAAIAKENGVNNKYVSRLDTLRIPRARHHGGDTRWPTAGRADTRRTARQSLTRLVESSGRASASRSITAELQREPSSAAAMRARGTTFPNFSIDGLPESHERCATVEETSCTRSLLISADGQTHSESPAVHSPQH